MVLEQGGEEQQERSLTGKDEEAELPAPWEQGRLWREGLLRKPTEPCSVGWGDHGGKEQGQGGCSMVLKSLEKEVEVEMERKERKGESRCD